MSSRKLHHLLLRAGFGPTAEEINGIFSKEKAIKQIFRESRSIDLLNELPDPLKGRRASNVKLAVLLLRSKEKTKKLNLAWLNKIETSEAQLREKMTFFWHGHFATRSPFAFLAQIQNNTLRKFALGNFREILLEISKDPAMILFLNNQENKKNAPNENYARELMELFTLGQGVLYSEKDIKEAARAFTGWQVSRYGKFEFNKEDHDFGEKEFLGRKGKFDGADIIDIILQHKETAQFLARKLYTFFVNDNIHEKHIQEVAETLYALNYEIEPTLKFIFSQDWFFSEDNIGGKIASPVELIARIRRLLNVQMVNEEVWLNMQYALGQVLFYPPNVAGWDNGKSWIDQSSIMYRVSLAPLLLEYQLPEWRNDMSWDILDKKFVNSIPRDIALSLLQQTDDRLMSQIADAVKNLTPGEKHRVSIVRTMMTPEFQLI